MGRARRGLDKAATITMNQLPLLIGLSVFVAGLVVAVAWSWRTGSFIMAGAMILVSMLCLILDQETAGLLVVRSKTFDCAISLIAGIAIGVLALVVPEVFV